jgi:hypothetical protein
MGRQGAAQLCMPARGADMTATHPAHQVLETKDFQAAANVIESLFTIDIPQNEETGPEERVWSAPAVSPASRVCSSASVCVVCVCVCGCSTARGLERY